MQSGVALTEAQIADARRIGVNRPDRVRLLKVQKILTPSHPALVTAAEATSLISPRTICLTLRYGIFIRNDHWDQRRLVVHELARTMQYERLGSIKAFLRQYLHECITIGYRGRPRRLSARRAGDWRGTTWLLECSFFIPFRKRRRNPVCHTWRSFGVRKTLP